LPPRTIVRRSNGNSLAVSRRRRLQIGRWDSAMSGHSSDQKVAKAMTGFKVQQP
jgi:hypothetical protein